MSRLVFMATLSPLGGTWTVSSQSPLAGVPPVPVAPPLGVPSVPPLPVAPPVGVVVAASGEPVAPPVGGALPPLPPSSPPPPPVPPVWEGAELEQARVPSSRSAIRFDVISAFPQHRGEVVGIPASVHRGREI